MQRYRLEGMQMVEHPNGEYVLHKEALTELNEAGQQLNQKQQELADKVGDIAQLNQDKNKLEGESLRAVRKLESINAIGGQASDDIKKVLEAIAIIKNAGVDVHERNANYGGTARAEVK